MSLLAVPIIAVLALFLVVISSAFFFMYLKKLKVKIEILDIQMQSSSFIIEEIQLFNHKLQRDLDIIIDNNKLYITENGQVSKQLELRIKKLQQQSYEQQQIIEQWQNSQGQDKFYNRAFKLAEKGAGIDEIIAECELPRAEVEMLLSVYQQRMNNQ